MSKIFSRAYEHPFALTLFVPMALLIVHAAFYMPFLVDDALISLRYAERLLDGKGLTWNDGFPVEGYSNLSWILLTAGLGSLGMDLILSSRLLGITCMLGILLANWIGWRDHLSGNRKPVFIGAQCLFSMSAPIAVWSIAGLEQPLVGLMLASAVVSIWKYLEAESQSLRYLGVASFCLGVLCITRPDGPLFSVSIAFAIILLRGINLKSISHGFLLAIFPLLMFGGQLLFRLSFYQDWVPNTAYAKVSPSLYHAFLGLLYVSIGLLLLAPFSHFVLKLFYTKNYDHEYRDRVVVSVCLLLPWMIYLVFIGGDIFAAFRHFVAIIVILTLTFPLVDKMLFDNKKYGENNYKKLKIYGGIFLVFQFFSPSSLLAHFERWEWDGQVLAKVLKTAYGDQQPLFAVTAAGTLPYFTGFPSVDMLGLNDHFLARHPPESFSGGFIGHELGNGPYVMSKSPDLISFCLPKGSLEACFISGKEMQQMPEFAESYVPVIYKGFDPYLVESIVWVMKDSDKVGVIKKRDQIEIPAYLFGGVEPAATYLNSEGRLVVDLTEGQELRFSYDGIAREIKWAEVYPASEAATVAFQVEEGVLVLTLKSDSDTKEVEKIVLGLAARG